MIQIAVCAHDPAEAGRLYALLMQYRGQNLTKNIKVRLFRDVESLLSELSAGETFDVCILDTVMPGTDGAAEIKAVRELYPQASVFLLTGAPHCAAAASADVTLAKPVAPDAFFAALARAAAAVPQG